MTRVEAPARLHFGLLSVPPTADRHFGGVGLMLDAPRLVVAGEAAERWEISGPLAERCRHFAERMVESLPAAERRPFQLTVEKCFPAHAGLGSGTALSLAVAKIIACESGHADWDAVELAIRVGRGARSAIGVHGFDRGGLIVDAGKGPGDVIAPLAGRLVLPEAWRVVLIQAIASDDWEGQKESRAFASATGNPTPVLRRLLETEIVPALAAGDLERLGEALHEYNARAGEAFRDAQRGVYASPAIAAVVERVRGLGVRGVGQSSWGPTVFAIVDDDERAEWLRRQAEGWQTAGVRVTRAAEGGARVTRLG